MKSLMKQFFEIFEKTRKIHVFFCLGLLSLCIVPVLVTRTLSSIKNVIAVYLFVLCCIYTGRWICRNCLLSREWFGLFRAALLALIVYGVAGTVGYIRLFSPELPITHFIETFVNVSSLTFLLLFIGFFVSVTRSAIKEKLNGLILAEQNRASELNLLKSQVSPHFLFNTLNNMYSLSINQPGKMPALLLKLSDLMRYAVYDAGQPFVKLKDELEYIKNYVELESIRASDRLLLNFHITNTADNLRISPMILIVFVENAFKYAKNTVEKEIHIKIEAKSEEDAFFFNVENSYIDDVPRQSSEKQRSGFGIANVIRRLDLLYPGNYVFNQHSNGECFKIELRLKLT